MSVDEQRSFRRWLAGNVVVASLFASLLIAMAGIGSLAPAGGNSATTALNSSDR